MGSDSTRRTGAGSDDSMAVRGATPTLTRAQWQRVDELYELAFDKPDSEREVYLETACDDPAVRTEVLSLLRCTPEAGDVLHAVIGDAAERFATSNGDPMVGRRLGPYRVIAPLGEGGMGAVYLAERDDAEYRRQVAIKVLRHGLGSPDAIARFRDERQILAGLEHPGIVRLLEGGTEAGLPYLVMEKVAGAPITQYAREHALSARDRVTLVRRVCDALAYAHERHVVHRDIKPSNILVGADGQPKLLDFGIAKLLGPEDDREARTRTGVALLTPAYASPEQARGESVTAASDVYSLGAVLYELLADRPPLDPCGNALDVVREISESEPARPSTLAPREVGHIGDDLDNIVLVALRKDPAQRYPTIAELGDDLGRYLDGKPVLARAPTLRYRASKLIRRHAVKLAIGMAGMAGAGVAVWIASRAPAPPPPPECATSNERLAGIWDSDRRSQLAARFAAGDKEFIRATGRLVVSELDDYAARWSAQHARACRPEARRDQLLYFQRHDCLDERLRALRLHTEHLLVSDPRAVSLEFEGLERIFSDFSLPLVEDCADERILRAQLPPLRDPEARAREADALFRLERTRFDKRVPLEVRDRIVEAVVHELEQLQAPSLPAATASHAAMLRFGHERAEAAANRELRERGDHALDRAIERAERSRDDATLARALVNRAVAFIREAESGQREYAADRVRDLLARANVALDRAGRPTNTLVLYLEVVKWHAVRVGDHESAIRYLADLVSTAERAYGARSLAAARARTTYADYLRNHDDTSRALALARQAQAIRTELLGDHHPQLVVASFEVCLLAAGELEEALRVLRGWQTILREALGPEDGRTVGNLDWIGHVQGQLGHLDDSIASYHAVVTAQHLDAHSLGWARFKLGEALVSRGRVLEAIPSFEESERLLTATMGIDHPDTVRGPRLALAIYDSALGRHEESRIRLKALQALLSRDLFDPDLRDRMKALLSGVDAHLTMHDGDLERAERQAHDALDAIACNATTGSFTWLRRDCAALVRLLSQVLGARDRTRERLALLEPRVAAAHAESTAHPDDQVARAVWLQMSAELGTAQLAAGDAKEALATLEPVVAEADAWAGDIWVPDARFALARALVASRGDPTRARGLAMKARDEYVALGNGKREEARAVETWLVRIGR